MGNLMYKRMTIGAAALAVAAGLGIQNAHAQDDDALNALLNDLGALVQNGAHDAEDAAPIAVGDVDIIILDEGEDVALDLDAAPVVVIDDVAPDAFDAPVAILDVGLDEPELVIIDLDDPAPIAPVAVAPVAPVVVAPAAPVLTEEEAAIKALAEIEGMRVQALINHAYETLELAKANAAKGNYQLAHEQFELAALFIPETDTAAREMARAGSHEALYNQAKLLYRNKLLEEALKTAQLARDKGNPRAARLIAEIQKDIDTPREEPRPIIDPARAPEYLAMRAEHRDLLRRASRLFTIGDLDQAQLFAEMVLRQDPYNTEAMTLRQTIGIRKQNIHNIESRSTKEVMLDEIESKWTAQGLYAVTTAEFGGIITNPLGGEESATLKARTAVEDKMRRIIIPEVNFRDAKIQDVVTFLQDASREYDDPNTPIEQRGVNFALRMPQAAAAAGGRDIFDLRGGAGGAGDGTLINFTTRYSNLHTILSTVMDLARMKYSIRDNIVTIMPADYVDTDMFTRSYTVKPDIVDIVGRANSDLAARRGAADIWGGGGGGAAATSNDDNQFRSLFVDLGVPFPNGSSIVYISAIGKLRVTNTAENLAKFDQVLAELNVQNRMVEIEARFVEVGVDALNSLGFEWSVDGAFGILGATQNIGTGAIMQGGKFKNAVGNLFDLSASGAAKDALGNPVGNISRSSRFLDGAFSGLASPFPDNRITSGPIKDSLVNLVTKVRGNDVSLIVHMLAQKNGTDVLSAPKVVTSPGMPAVMKVTREYIYPRSFNVDSFQNNGGGNNNNSVQNALPYVEPTDFNFDDPTDVGVILEVTPEVSADGQLITMNLNPRVVELNEWIDYGYDIPTFDPVTGSLSSYHLKMQVPIFSRREVNANISIYNGATVVMGGMITEKRIKVEDKIPYLGDIPYLGQFFRSTVDFSEKRNLLIFVTARLVDPAGRPVQAFDASKDLAAPIN